MNCDCLLVCAVDAAWSNHGFALTCLIALLIMCFTAVSLAIVDMIARVMTSRQG